MLNKIGLIVLLCAVPFFGEGFAAELVSETAGARDASFGNYLDMMRKRAVREGVSLAVVNTAFRSLKLNPRILELSRHQPEFKLPVRVYLDKAVTNQRIIDGRRNLDKYAQILEAIEKRYGVPRRYLLAVWGMESDYGKKKGDYHVVQALATLGYRGHRKRFGRSQLIAALRILQHRDIPLSKFFGSWAGAMGHTQFIPTTYNAYAVDWTGDGTRDIWNSVSDALASTARYLKVSGWRKDVPWGREVVLARNFDHRLAGIKSRKPRRTADWIKLGVKPVGGRSFGSWKQEAWLIRPHGSKGQAFLVSQNFRAILRYNNAVSYALAIIQLGNRIAGRPGSIAN